MENGKVHPILDGKQWNERKCNKKNENDGCMNTIMIVDIPRETKKV